MDHQILLCEEGNGWQATVIHVSGAMRKTGLYKLADEAYSRLMALLEAEMLIESWGA